MLIEYSINRFKTSQKKYSQVIINFVAEWAMKLQVVKVEDLKRTGVPVLDLQRKLKLILKV